MNFKSQNDSALEALENLRKRLLVLNARNRLLNFKHTKNRSIRIIDELPNQLTEVLCSGQKMKIIPVPEPIKEQLIEAGYIEIDNETNEEIILKPNPSAKEWAEFLNLETAYESPIEDSTKDEKKHTDNAIQTLFFPYEIEARLRNLRQLSKSAIEETGANILYLGLGFLVTFSPKPVPVKSREIWQNRSI